MGAAGSARERPRRYIVQPRLPELLQGHESHSVNGVMGDCVTREVAGYDSHWGTGIRRRGSGAGINWVVMGSMGRYNAFL